MRPYAISSCGTTLSRNDRTRSGCTGAPAMIPVLRDERSAVRLCSSLHRSTNMVGTPCRTVGRWRSTRSIRSPASNSSCSTREEPETTAVNSAEPSPKMLNNGTAHRVQSESTRPMPSAVEIAVLSRLLCDSTTPLCFSDTPAVYRMAAGSSSPTGTGVHTCPLPAETRSSNWKILSSYHRSSSPTVTRYCRPGNSENIPSNSSR